MTRKSRAGVTHLDGPCPLWVWHSVRKRLFGYVIRDVPIGFVPYRTDSVQLHPLNIDREADQYVEF